MDTTTLLDSHLHRLNLPVFAEQYAQVADEAARANLSYDRFLLLLAEQELAQRDVVRQRHCIKAARFPMLKELADFDFGVIPTLNRARILELARGQYLTTADTILLIGNPGLGKTHIATGLAVAACRQRQRVRFYTAAALVNDLLAAQAEQRLGRLIATALKHQLIVLDELGFLPLSPTGAQLLFQFCSALHERVALIVTSNLRFADWPQVFGSESLTAALLDRLTARAHILEFVGESFRLRQRQRREANGWIGDIPIPGDVTPPPVVGGAGHPPAGRRPAPTTRPAPPPR
jgi:DNA replication protein DnaC